MENLIREKTTVSSKEELLEVPDFKKILKIYKIFSLSFHRALMLVETKGFHIDDDFWRTLTTDECKELFGLIPSERIHNKLILFRILLHRKQINVSNLNKYLQGIDSIDAHEKMFELFEEYTGVKE